MRYDNENFSCHQNFRNILVTYNFIGSKFVAALIGAEAEASGGNNKARKALLFEETTAGHDLVSTGEGVEHAGNLVLKMQSEDDDAVKKDDERALHKQALDEANMMLEGELLSDSELLLEEGEELEDWEHGEITDGMEEEEHVGEGVEEGEQAVMRNDLRGRSGLVTA
ncbi:hypothetical protein F2Q69_00029559 [Brassica cretica]|uniref:Uncharacterized protein n=1 Tax=Brassica cretica TaxID=69181 RepID=A0A8S9S468_BRACR|nr:hypothetical protein F2Q69_00029559 [Brassica cretica]